MTSTTTDDPLRARAKALKLYGLLAHWEEVAGSDWIEPLIRWEEQERARRSLERRLGNAHLGRFRPLADFDWDWPKRCDREAIEELMTLGFLKEAANAILVGPNGVGKSTIARNIAHQAVLAGHTVLCTSAGHMLNELAGADGDRALRHRLALYARPRLLVLYQEKSTLITTNRPFAEWGEVFPNAACVVSLVDRLVHNAEIIPIEGESYRLKEAKERSEQRRKQRAARKTKSKPPRSPHSDD